MGKNKILIILFGLIFWVIMVMGSNPRLDLCQQQPLLSPIVTVTLPYKAAPLTVAYTALAMKLKNLRGISLHHIRPCLLMFISHF